MAKLKIRDPEYLAMLKERQAERIAASELADQPQTLDVNQMNEAEANLGVPVSPDNFYDYLGATYKPEQLAAAGISDMEQQRLNKQRAEADYAMGGIQGAQQYMPTGLSVLENALKEVSGVGQMQTGGSELYKELGIKGYGALTASLAQTANEQKAKYNSFANALNAVGMRQNFEFQQNLSKYTQLMKEYETATKKVDDILAEQRQMENTLELYERKAIIDQRLKQETEPKIIEYKGQKGTVEGGVFTPLTTQGEMRTDRHNNPTAFTTQIAKQAGLKEGVDYIAGDQFPDNPNLRTAKLLGDPLEITRRVIDNIGFYTGGGAQRWTHTAIPDEQWSAMSTDEKNEVIKSMYQKEGGSGSLFGEGAGERKLIDEIRKLGTFAAYDLDNVVNEIAVDDPQMASQVLAAGSGDYTGILPQDQIKYTDVAFNLTKGDTKSKVKAAATVASALADGDTERAKRLTYMALNSSLDNATSKELRAGLSMLKDLNYIKGIFQEMEGTNFVSGNINELANKIGFSTMKDKQKAKQEVERLIQAYVKGQSGAQFSVKEMERYAGVFPSLSKLGSLNADAIDGLINQLGNEVNGIVYNETGFNMDNIFDFVPKSEHDAFIKLSKDPDRFPLLLMGSEYDPNALASEFSQDPEIQQMQNQQQQLMGELQYLQSLLR